MSVAKPLPTRGDFVIAMGELLAVRGPDGGGQMYVVGSGGVMVLRSEGEGVKWSRRTLGNPSTTEQCSVSVAKPLPTRGDFVIAMGELLAVRGPDVGGQMYVVGSGGMMTLRSEEEGVKWSRRTLLPASPRTVRVRMTINHPWRQAEVTEELAGGVRVKMLEGPLEGKTFLFYYQIEAGAGGLIIDDVRCPLKTSLMCSVVGCSSFAASPKGLCTIHERPVGAGAVRACAVPECGCVLGTDVEGDLCAIHRRQALEKCARKGCGKPHLKNSVYCRGHRLCATSVSHDNLPAVPEREEGCECCHVGQPCTCCELHRGLQGVYLHTRKLDRCDSSIPEEEEQPSDKQPPSPPTKDYRDCLGSIIEMQAAWREACDLAWEGLADDSGLDPRTVAVCKRMRDLEVCR